MNRKWLSGINTVCCVVMLVSLACVTPVIANTYGTFTAVYVSSNVPTSVDAGDIDHDMDLDPDLVVSTPSTLGWYRNDGSGATWSSYISIDSTNWGCVTVFLNDFDGDFDLDIIGGRKDQMTNTCYACWWENDSGDGSSWTRHDMSSIGTSGPVHWVEAADIDADGKMDVAYAQYNEIGWVRQTGGTAPNFTYSKTTLESSSYQYRCAHPANLDSDSNLEITGTLYYGSLPWVNHNVSIWGLPQGGRVDISTNSSNPLSGAWAAWDLDYDGDGDQDLAVCSLGTDQTKIWTNQGSGSFAYHSQVAGATSLRSGNFGGSGPTRQSLVTGGDYRILNWTGSAWDTTNVHLNTGNTSQAGLCVRDVDLDGYLDIAGPAGSVINLYLN